MLSTSPARIALHAELAALADAFFAARAPVEAVEAVEPSTPSAVACDGSTGWASRYLGALVETVEPSRYVILARNGFEFTSEGCDYAIRHHGVRVMTDMHKLNVERLFMRLSSGDNAFGYPRT